MNIFKIYIQSYSNTDVIQIDEKIANEYAFDNFSNGNIPILDNGCVSQLYQSLYELTH